MLIGFTDSYSIGAQNGYFSNISWEDGFFAQDEWRLNRRLTLQLGMRYDISPGPMKPRIVRLPSTSIPAVRPTVRC